MTHHSSTLFLNPEWIEAGKSCPSDPLACPRSHTESTPWPLRRLAKVTVDCLTAEFLSVAAADSYQLVVLRIQETCLHFSSVYLS